MSGLEAAALFIVATWLGLLTLVIVLMVRQIALITERIDQTGVPQYIDDGPALQSRVPDVVLNAVPQLNTGTTNLLLLSATCTPCRQLAEELQHKVLPKTAAAVALVPGREELADSIVALLPSAVQTVRDPEATEVAQILELQRVPSAIVIERGTVIAKAPPVNSADELLSFLTENSGSPSVTPFVPAS